MVGSICQWFEEFLFTVELKGGLYDSMFLFLFFLFLLGLRVGLYFNL